jgi:hypothetical protein
VSCASESSPCRRQLCRIAECASEGKSWLDKTLCAGMSASALRQRDVHFGHEASLSVSVSIFQRARVGAMADSTFGTLTSGRCPLGLHALTTTSPEPPCPFIHTVMTFPTRRSAVSLALLISACFRMPCSIPQLLRRQRAPNLSIAMIGTRQLSTNFGLSSASIHACFPNRRIGIAETPAVGQQRQGSGPGQGSQALTGPGHSGNSREPSHS